MKKVIYNGYGNADVLTLADVALPAISAQQILVQVKATAINPLDWKIFEGQMKIMTGSKFPRGIGFEFSGIVSAVGSQVSEYKTGDEVFGMLDAFKGEALAEFIVVESKQLHRKPKALSFEQAAALPVGGLSALQILDDLAGVKSGTEVLILGATGGVGAFATQLAKHRGAIVTAVVGTRGVPLVEKWGVDCVVDYKKQRVAELSKRFDVVIDLSDTLPFASASSIMKSQSVYVNALPNPKDIVVGFFNNVISGRKRKILMMKPSPARLTALCTDASDWLQIVVGNTFTIDSFKQAYTQTKTGGTLGKAVITVS